MKTTLIITFILCSMGLFAQSADKPATEKEAVPAVQANKHMNVNQKIEKTELTPQDPGTAQKKEYQNTEEALRDSDFNRSEIQKEINEIRVISTASYEQLTAEQKQKIDDDPLYFVSDKDKKQVIAEYARKKLRAAEQ